MSQYHVFFHRHLLYSNDTSCWATFSEIVKSQYIFLFNGQLKDYEKDYGKTGDDCNQEHDKRPCPGDNKGEGKVDPGARSLT